MLEYKAARYGRTFARVDRFFPSTRMCCDCGGINDKMALNVRAWDCPCGSHHDRDVNAAMNMLGRRTGGESKRPWSAGKTGTRPGTARRSGNPPGRRVFHAQRGGNLRPLGRRGCQSIRDLICVFVVVGLGVGGLAQGAKVGALDPRLFLPAPHPFRLDLTAEA